MSFFAAPFPYPNQRQPTQYIEKNVDTASQGSNRIVICSDDKKLLAKVASEIRKKEDLAFCYANLNDD